MPYTAVRFTHHKFRLSHYFCFYRPGGDKLMRVPKAKCLVVEILLILAAIVQHTGNVFDVENTYDALLWSLNEMVCSYVGVADTYTLQSLGCTARSL